MNGLKLWTEYPVSGCGPGAWRKATGSLIESHNLYGQLLGEMGTLGIVTFAAILVGFWMNLRWIRKAYERHPEWGHDFLYRVANSVGLGVLLLLFLGNFGHNLFRYSWYWYAGFLIITRYSFSNGYIAKRWWMNSKRFPKWRNRSLQPKGFSPWIGTPPSFER